MTDVSYWNVGLKISVNIHGCQQPSTPINFWGAGKDFQAAGNEGADAGTRSRASNGKRVGRSRTVRYWQARLAIAFGLLASSLAIGSFEGATIMQYVKPDISAFGELSIKHASSWVALKGPWRHHCARDRGREELILSGCITDVSYWNVGLLYGHR